MPAQPVETLRLKRYSLPEVEVFEVTREQLEKIKGDQRQV